MAQAAGLALISEVCPPSLPTPPGLCSGWAKLRNLPKCPASIRELDVASPVAVGEGFRVWSQGRGRMHAR